MKVKVILISLIFLELSTGIKAQLSPVTDQYILNPILINPANAGLRGSMNIAGFYRRQWAGLKGAPETFTLVGDAPLRNENVGLGVAFTYDKIGVTRETAFSSLYSYRIKTASGNLGFGLKAGFLATNTRYSDLVVLDPGDELYLLDSRTFLVPDFSFGAYYSGPDYFAGFSIPRLFGYSFNFDKNKYSVRVRPEDYYYMLNGGYSFAIAEDIRFLPSFLLSISPGEKALLDLNAHLSFSDRLWVGSSFRTNGSVSALVQFAVNTHLKIAYSYYVDFSRLGRFSSGSHEIMLRYEFRYKADVVNPLIF